MIVVRVEGIRVEIRKERLADEAVQTALELGLAMIIKRRLKEEKRNLIESVMLSLLK